MAATIKDIAKKLNYSTSTVSYALNGGPRPVPEAVKENVFAVARELGYRPNRIAKSLVTRQSRTIGIVLQRSTHDVFLAPYLNAVFNAVMNVAEDRLYDVLVFSQHKTATVAQFTNLLLDGRVDGVLLISSAALPELARDLQAYGLPATAMFTSDLGVPRVLANNQGGVRQALEHLVSLGHRKIGLVTGPDGLIDSEERRAAFTEFIAEKGLEWHAEWAFNGNFDQPGGYAAGKYFLGLSDGPTALFTSNDEMAVGAYLALQEAGVSIPTDLSIVGFDDIPHARYLTPHLTTVRQPMGAIGSAAAEHLIAIIEGQSAPSLTLFDTELVVRGSTASPK